MPQKLSDDEANDLVRRYVAGESTKQLGPAFGVSSRVVSDYLRRAGVAARPKHCGIVRYMAEMSPEDRSAMCSANSRRVWANATEEQRRHAVQAAHDTWRGSHHSEEACCKIATRKAARAQSDSGFEAQFADWLKERGVAFTQQLAIGRYNVDFAVGNVAVEIMTNWTRRKEWRVKLAYLFDHGWNFYAVWHESGNGFLPAFADDLITWAKILESTPASGSQHRVVWCARKVLSTGSGDADYVAAVFKSQTPLGDWPLYHGAGE